ncbi:uncharacterized protein LOC141697564 [Apium graveolens]|uniref:uncharacterized protein LOC141697564 n=1 Tax=Apium graveolens TaxID=4045 RepID=UPI003D7A944B
MSAKKMSRKRNSIAVPYSPINFLNSSRNGTAEIGISESTVADKGKRHVDVQMNPDDLEEESEMDSVVSESFSDHDDLEQFIFDRNFESGDDLKCPSWKIDFNEMELPENTYDLNNDNDYSYVARMHSDQSDGESVEDILENVNFPSYEDMKVCVEGGKVDNSINNGGAPYIYRLNGQNHHLFGYLIPEKDDDPKFCQLYIYDTENEISNRLKWVNVDGGSVVDAKIVAGLSAMLDETNELVKEFCTAWDRFEKDGVQDSVIRLKVCRSESSRENHVGPSDEVVGVMVGDIDDSDGSRDIVKDSHVKGLERISDIHPKLMALQYPLLFPHGSDGFHKKIPFGKVDEKSQKKIEFITQKEYYSYKFQARSNECSRRYMQQNFQDALAVCRHIGHPDIFLTMTTNPLWDEKRGLPHVHMLIWLDAASKANLQANVDKYISAEIPDPQIEPVGYAVVNAFMVKYQCHMNVEIYAHARSLKYLFKYCLKGHDRATVEIMGKKRQSSSGEGLNEAEDEIQSFFDWRYICGCEVAYRIFGFNIHYRSLTEYGIHASVAKKIGRLSYTHHSAGELWFLRLLLTKVLSQFSESGFPHQIRQLFVHIMVNYKVSDLNDIWNRHWTAVIDDILLKQQQLTRNPHMMLNDKQQQYYALAEIHTLLKSIGKSLKDYSQMPQPPNTYLDCNVNNLIIEETNYDINEMEKEFQNLYKKYNKEQLQVYSSVMKSVEKNEGVTSSGIAATLMPGGRTAHSRFKIPIVIDEHSMCSISHTSDIVELIKRTNLIIWDEAHMQHRYAFECLDRSLRDVLKAVDPKRFHMPFGGITVVLGGDFHQILPIIPRPSRGEVVSASITRSRIWKIATIFKLLHNI